MSDVPPPPVINLICIYTYIFIIYPCIIVSRSLINMFLLFLNQWRFLILIDFYENKIKNLEKEIDQLFNELKNDIFAVLSIIIICPYINTSLIFYVHIHHFILDF